MITAPAPAAVHIEGQTAIEVPPATVPDHTAGGMLIGYARVSTRHQDVSTQVTQLNAAGCSRIFSETFTGSRMRRPQFDACLEFMRPGDTLTVTRLKRLGRNTRGLLDLVDVLRARDLELRSLAESFDTRTIQGRMLFTVLAAVAEMDRELTIEAVNDGLEIARDAGRVGGRPRALTPEQVDNARQLIEGGATASSVARTFGIARATLYRSLS
jgi:DNA invertase Pin-like site-specific DNA recombinase